MPATKIWRRMTLPIGISMSEASSTVRCSSRSPSFVHFLLALTRHDCVEGWSCIGKWRDVPLSTLLDKVGPQSAARYVMFFSADPMEQTLDGSDSRYYESIDMQGAYHLQTILAYDMNDQVLPIPMKHHFGCATSAHSATRWRNTSCVFIKRLCMVLGICIGSAVQGRFSLRPVGHHLLVHWASDDTVFSIELFAIGAAVFTVNTIAYDAETMCFEGVASRWGKCPVWIRFLSRGCAVSRRGTAR
jgi:molybdopterin-dependent oxidoreductase-like protein protein